MKRSTLPLLQGWPSAMRRYSSRNGSTTGAKSPLNSTPMSDLGEFTLAVLWTLPSLFWRTPTPSFP